MAQKFARVAVAGDAHRRPRREAFYGRGFDAYLDLLRTSAPLGRGARAPRSFSASGSTRGSAGRSSGSSSGGRSTAAREDRHRSPPRLTISRLRRSWLRPDAPNGESLATLERLAARRPAGPQPGPRRERRRSELGRALDAARLLRAARPVILVGSGAPPLRARRRASRLSRAARRSVGAGVVPLPVFANLFGSVLMGATPSCSRAAAPSRPAGSDDGSAPGAFLQGALDVLYLVGETPPPRASRASSSPRTSASRRAGRAARPRPSRGGLHRGRRQRRERRGAGPAPATRPSSRPGEALPDWEILCRIAARWGRRLRVLGGRGPRGDRCSSRVLGARALAAHRSFDEA